MTKAEYRRIAKTDRRVNHVERLVGGRWEQVVCCADTKRMQGISLRCLTVPRGWTPKLIEQYKRFMRECNPKFYKWVENSRLEDKLPITVDSDNFAEQFQAWCLWRAIWEAPEYSAAMLYLWTSRNKHEALTPAMIQLICNPLCANWNHTTHCPIKPGKKLNDVLRRLTRPDKVERGYNSTEYINGGGVNYHSELIPTLDDPTNKSTVDRLINKLIEEAQ